MSLTPRSVRLRLTMWHAMTLAVIIVIFSVSVYYFLRQSLRAQLDGQVSKDVAVLEAMASNGEIDESVDLEEIEQEQLIEYFQLRQTDRPAYRSRAWQRAGLNAALDRIGPPALRSVKAADGRVFRLVSTASLAGGDTTYIAVARPENPLQENLRRLRLVLALGLPIAFLLAAAGGFFLAGRALSPIQTMAAKARLITAENLAERLPVENPNDELGQLAEVFNGTLARLQEAFERLRRFTADASHELRTPLTVIRSVGEVGLRKQRDAAAYRETIGSMLEEADRLARLTENLLALTRLDAGSVSRAEAPTEISSLVTEAVDCLRVLAEEKSQQMILDLEPGIIVWMDRVMIRQALINILDNAIKYSPPERSISISTRKTDAETVRIAVEDEGPGSPANERGRIFERFYRAPASSAADGGGSGLGLSIAKEAVEACGGRIEVSTGKNGGTVFTIELQQRKG
jgi:heavy metal sensor kinase